MEPLIRSSSNPKLSLLTRVLQGKERGLIVLEGERLIEDALRAGVELTLLFAAPEQAAFVAGLATKVREVAWVELALLRRKSRLETSSGLLALAPSPPRRAFAEMKLTAESLWIITCGIADPGNLGAIARSAEALGASAICPLGGASPLGEKALRGSMGSLLRLPILTAESPQAAFLELRRLGLRQVMAATRGGCHPRDLDWRAPLALWILGETGQSPELPSEVAKVTLPMAAAIESLNVAVATALLLYAAREARESHS